MQLTIRRSSDNAEKTFDTNTTGEEIIENWLAGQIGYVCAIIGNPAQDDICIPAARQQPKYNPHLLTGGLNPFLAHNRTTNVYTMIGVGPGVEYVGLRNRVLPPHERQLLETEIMTDWRIY